MESLRRAQRCVSIIYLSLTEAYETARSGDYNFNKDIYTIYFSITRLPDYLDYLRKSVTIHKFIFSNVCLVLSYLSHDTT